ncbi:MAG: hypothetical protein ACO1PM_15575 [Acidovorax sp.]
MPVLSKPKRSVQPRQGSQAVAGRVRRLSWCVRRPVPSGWGGQAWEQFIDGCSADVGCAPAFLQADPWYHRSGYHKQVVWHRFKRTLLTREELQLLEGVALDYLGRLVRREFWCMLRFVRLRAGAGFWQRVEQMASDPVRLAPAIKATWLVLARQNEPVPRAIANEVRRAG